MRPPRKNDEVYRTLRRRCIMSEFPPGSQLVELELAADMGCSQSTIREALLRLQEEGLIIRQGYRGTVVTEISADEEQLLFDLRVTLEVQSARRTRDHLTKADLDRLEQIVDEMEDAAGRDDSYALFEAELEFHKTLLDIARLPALQRILNLCSVCIHRIKIARSRNVQSLMETARRHRAVTRVLAEGSADDVERVMREHIRRTNDAADARPRVARADDGRFTPDMLTVFQRIKAEDAGLPDVTLLPIDAARRQFDATHKRWNRIDAGGFEIAAFSIPRADDAIAAVRVVPKGVVPWGTILHIHGGGFVFGNNRTHLGAMTRLASASGCAVIGIDYALAPEAPFPAGLNDCAWAWRWLRAGQRHVDDVAGPWFLAGDSAGANLALALMLDLRYAAEPMPAAAALFYGNFAPGNDGLSHERFGNGEFGLTSAKMAWYRQQYLNGRANNPRDPRASPLLADLSDLPPLFVTAAGLDPLRDDSTALVQSLAKTNTTFEFRVYEGVVHGFMQMGEVLPEARKAFEEAGEFIRRFERR
jgi:acetyl esterase/lipase/DNA-binding FadR family transcriptional regulator